VSRAHSISSLLLTDPISAGILHMSY
jgi:hypothetical protein